MTIRKAESSDIPAIVEMARQMADLHHALDSYYKSSTAYKTLEEDFSEELEDKDSALIVAEDSSANLTAGGRKIVGYFRGMIEPAPTYLSPKKIGIVHDLFILPEYRKKRTGEKLFTAALQWFKDRNIKNVELNVDARNITGVAFWKKHGFLEYKFRMRLDLQKED